MRSAAPVVCKGEAGHVVDAEVAVLVWWGSTGSVAADEAVAPAKGKHELRILHEVLAAVGDVDLLQKHVLDDPAPPAAEHAASSSERSPASTSHH